MSIENKFILPYQRNPRFTGRKNFLEKLKEELFAHDLKRYNHRVALYGMGGVGKTQIALEYAYANQAYYNRILWISAVNEDSLLSGFQTIAKTAQLPIWVGANSIEIAKFVLGWLRKKESWLIVIDNLDEIEIVEGLLPENDFGKH